MSSLSHHVEPYSDRGERTQETMKAPPRPFWLFTASIVIALIALAAVVQTERLQRARERADVYKGALDLAVGAAEAPRFVVASKIQRASADTVIVVGDSITAASDLPKIICGHLVINGGVGGIGVSGFDALWKNLPSGRANPALIVVALGTNDTHNRDFASQYASFLGTVGDGNLRLVLAGVPPIGNNKHGHDAVGAERNNAIIASIAHERLIPFADVRSAVSIDDLSDGIHIKQEAYTGWRNAVVSAAEGALGCKRSE